MSREQTFRVGNLVRFAYGPHKTNGVIKEDRGPIGKGGRRLYLIAFRPEPTHPAESFIELPAEQLELVEKTISLQ